MSNPPIDPLKEKFRPDVDADLDKEISDALGGLSVEQIEAQTPPAARARSPSRTTPPSSTPPAKGVRRGRVVNIRKGDVLVDLGGKSQGIISELQFDDEPPVVGKEYDFSVERYDKTEGLIILSRRMAGAVQQTVTWENIEVGTLVEGTVTGMNKGGLELQVKSMRAFMPAGQVNLFFEKDISVYLGQKLVVEVTQADALTHNLVVSRRNVLEREKEEAKKKLLEEIQEGDSRRGTVRSVMDFGAFVDLGGADGLVHVSEMSYKRIRHPSEVVKVGDQVDVKILKIDKATGKLSLSMRQAHARPVGRPGQPIPRRAPASPARSRAVENFGAFIELEEGIEGLLPVSEMSWQRIRSPKDVVKPGDTLRLVVLAIDPAAAEADLQPEAGRPRPVEGGRREIRRRHDRHRQGDARGRLRRVRRARAGPRRAGAHQRAVRTSASAPPPTPSSPGRRSKCASSKWTRRPAGSRLSIRRAIEIAPPPPPSPEQLAAREAEKKKKAAREKKRGELKGGLDFDFWNKKL